MEDHISLGDRVPPGAPLAEQLGEVAADRGHPLVRGQVRGDGRPVDQRHPRQRACPAARHIQPARGQQLPGEAGAKEAGPAGDYHVRRPLDATETGEVRRDFHLRHLRSAGAAIWA